MGLLRETGTHRTDNAADRRSVCPSVGACVRASASALHGAGQQARLRCGTAKAKQINNGRPLKINPQNRPKKRTWPPRRRSEIRPGEFPAPVPTAPSACPPLSSSFESRALSPSAPANSWNRPSESCPSLTTGKAPCGPTEREKEIDCPGTDEGLHDAFIESSSSSCARTWQC